MVPSTECVNSKNQHVAMVLLHEEEDDHSYEDKRSNKAQRADKFRKLRI